MGHINTTVSPEGAKRKKKLKLLAREVHTSPKNSKHEKGPLKGF